MRAGLNDMTVNLLVHTIRDLILGGDDELEKFSELMKSDIVQASDRNDVEFINKVIVPILQAEEKVPVTISVVNQQSL
jgi:ligand-binding sensor protein